MRKLMAFFCLILSFAALVPFLYMHLDTQNTPEGQTKIFTIGLPSSPWLIKTDTRKTETVAGEIRTKTASSTHKIEFLSLSWLFLIATIALFQIRRVLLGVVNGASSAGPSPSATAGRRTRTPPSGA